MMQRCMKSRFWQHALMGTFLLHVSDAFTSPLQSSLYGNLMNAPIFKSNQPSTILSMSASYGKGAEIWPETNLEPIRLGDSFPTRQVPGMLDAMVEISKNKSTTPIDIQFSSFDKLSIGLVCSLLTLRLVSFGEIFFSVSFSTYLILLTRINVAMAKNKSVVVPSLPPLGHIPSLVANPLGQGFTNSPTYRLWLRMGVVGSVFLPLISLLWCLVGSRDSVAASFVAKPLYLICFQSVSEVIAKKSMVPLPLRILIPLSYNTARLIPLWKWLSTSSNLGFLGRLLALFNFVYWTLNLFAFLIPNATMKYMRSHFFCVEASEVTLREDGESAAGILPRVS